jgi:hypothetical protein
MKRGRQASMAKIHARDRNKVKRTATITVPWRQKKSASFQSMATANRHELVLQEIFAFRSMMPFFF